MKPAMRRLILLAVSVSAGGILVVFDAPVHLVLLNTIMVGFIMLILLGIVRISKKGEDADAGKEKKAPAPKEKDHRQEKRSGIKERLSALRAKRTKEEPKAAPVRDARPSRLVALKAIPAYVGGLAGALSANLASWRNKDSETKKIDTLLDRAIHDPLAEDFPTFDHLGPAPGGEETVEVERRIAQKIDKLSSLTAEELKHLESEVNEKLFGEDDDDVDEGMLDEPDLAGFGITEMADTAAGGNEFDDLEMPSLDSIDLPGDEEYAGQEPASLADLHMGDAFPDLMDGEDAAFAGRADIDPTELDNLSDMSDIGFGDEDLSDLGSIDLDDIEPDGGGGNGDDAAPFGAEDHEPAPISVESPAVKASEAAADLAADEVGSFGFGGDDDADIMHMLKQETRRPRAVQDASLLRELKDVDVDTGDLVEELESVLSILNKKS